jgi:hypothetical protein
MNETDRASSPTAHTITPHLVVGGAAQAADWYQQAFGAQVGARIPVPGGKFIQIEVRLGDATVMLADEFPDLGVLSPLTLGGPTARSTSPPRTPTPCGTVRSQPVPRCTSRCRTCSGVTATGSSSTPSATVGGFLNASATCRPRRSPEPRQPCSAARRADDWHGMQGVRGSNPLSSTRHNATPGHPHWFRQSATGCRPRLAAGAELTARH